MTRAKIGQLKNHLSRYLELVRAGGEVLVLDRDRPIARIVPLGQTPARGEPDDERLERLERRGLVRRGSGKLPPWFGKRRPLRVKGSVLQDLLAERETGW